MYIYMYIYTDICIYIVYIYIYSAYICIYYIYTCVILYEFMICAYTLVLKLEKKAAIKRTRAATWYRKLGSRCGWQRA